MAVAARPDESLPKRPPRDEEKRLELTEHLGELRARIIRVVLYVTIGACVCYFYFKPIYRFLFLPMEHAMASHKADWKIVFHQGTLVQAP